MKKAAALVLFAVFVAGSQFASVRGKCARREPMIRRGHLVFVHQ